MVLLRYNMTAKRIKVHAETRKSFWEASITSLQTCHLAGVIQVQHEGITADIKQKSAQSSIRLRYCKRRYGGPVMGTRLCGPTKPRWCSSHWSRKSWYRVKDDTLMIHRCKVWSEAIYWRERADFSCKLILSQKFYDSRPTIEFRDEYIFTPLEPPELGLYPASLWSLRHDFYNKH